MARCIPLPVDKTAAPLCSRILESCRDCFSHHLTGVYLHGSLAFGCFQWERSDLDVLVVVRRSPCLGDKAAFCRALLELTPAAPPAGLEMSVVLEETCRRFVYPTPYELHLSPAHLSACRENPEAYCQAMQGTDSDLALHFAVTRAVGIPLWGPEPQALFAPVPRQSCLASLRQDARWAVREKGAENPYTVLNLCRALCYIRSGLLLSKPQAGRWGLTHLPGAYAPLLQACLLCQETGAPLTCPEGLADAFCRAVLPQVLGQDTPSPAGSGDAPG